MVLRGGTAGPERHLVSKGMVFSLCRAWKEGGRDSTVQGGQGDLRRIMRLLIWVNPSEEQ